MSGFAAFPVNRLKINLVVERQWHVGPHAAALESCGRDYGLYGGFPSVRYVSLGIPRNRIHSCPLPALWNHVAARMRLPRPLQLDAPRMIAKWASGRMEPRSLVICYSTVYGYLFPMLAARFRNQPSLTPVLVIERGSTHPVDYFHAIQRGFNEAGLPWSHDLPAGVRSEIEACDAAHFIVAGSDVIAESYRLRGVPDERILKIPYGTDAELFEFRDRAPARGGIVNVACVGYIGIRKGIWRLIRIAQWAERRHLRIKIHLVGPMEAETPSLLEQCRIPMQIHGVKKGRELVKVLHDCHLYCLPSYEEGFGISVIEAMATGLPAIVSEEAGVKEAISPGGDGIILRSYDDATLDSQLRPLIESRFIRDSMGRNAREKVLCSYTNRHYAERLRDEYKRMDSIIEAAGGALRPIGCYSVTRG
jgi:glycosyltransferase involved in cell wall biosynthesis